VKKHKIFLEKNQILDRIASNAPGTQKRKKDHRPKAGGRIDKT
jgi:hypothetical protein